MLDHDIRSFLSEADGLGAQDARVWLEAGEMLFEELLDNDNKGD